MGQDFLDTQYYCTKHYSEKLVLKRKIRKISGFTEVVPKHLLALVISGFGSKDSFARILRNTDPITFEIRFLAGFRRTAFLGIRIQDRRYSGSGFSPEKDPWYLY